VNVCRSRYSIIATKSGNGCCRRDIWVISNEAELLYCSCTKFSSKAPSECIHPLPMPWRRDTVTWILWIHFRWKPNGAVATNNRLPICEMSKRGYELGVAPFHPSPETGVVGLVSDLLYYERELLTATIGLLAAYWHDRELWANSCLYLCYVSLICYLWYLVECAHMVIFCFKTPHSVQRTRLGAATGTHV